MANTKFYILPYHNGKLDCKMSEKELIQIADGINEEYKPKDSAYKMVDINIVTIEDSDFYYELSESMNFLFSDVSFLNIDSAYELYNLYNNEDEDSFLAVNGYCPNAGGNVINTQKYLNTEEVLEDNIKGYCIPVVYIKDGKLERYTADEIIDLIYEINTNKPIALWYHVGYFDMFDNTEEYLAELASAIDNECKTNADIVVTYKTLDTFGYNKYRIVCTSDLVSYHGLYYYDYDIKITDNKPVIKDCDKIAVLYPYNGKRELLNLSTVSDIVWNIKSLTNNDNKIEIQPFTKEDYDLLSNRFNKSSDCLILQPQDYITKTYEKNIVADSLLMDKDDVFTNIELYSPFQFH